VKIFYHHVGLKGAERDFPKTINAFNNIELIKKSVPKSNPIKEELIDKLNRQFPKGEFNCWGVPSGAKSVIKNLEEGDAVLLVEKASLEDGYVRVLGIVKVYFSIPMEELSNALWGENRFPYIFFFDTERIQLPWFDFINHLGYKTNFRPSGNFYKVGPDRLENYRPFSKYIDFIRSSYSEQKTPFLKYELPEKERTFQEDREKYETKINSLIKKLEKKLDSPPQLKDAKEKVNRQRIETPRDKAFGTVVKRIYENKCCICETSMKTPDNHPEVQGAHIYPKSKNGSDDIRNGIALCRIHHWAFDCGWIGISDNFEVIVNPKLPKEKDYEIIRRYNGKKIYLPKNEIFHPGKLYLTEHRKIYNL